MRGEEILVVLGMPLHFCLYRQGSLNDGGGSGCVDDHLREHMYQRRVVYVHDEVESDSHDMCFLAVETVHGRLVDKSHPPWPYHQIWNDSEVSSWFKTCIQLCDCRRAVESKVHSAK